MNDDVRWAKLHDGTWGVSSPSDLAPGQRVTVTRRDGSISTVTVVAKTGVSSGLTTYQVKAVAKYHPRGPAETKRCWECGHDFTYEECKNLDGDWADSYCGC